MLYWFTGEGGGGGGGEGGGGFGTRLCPDSGPAGEILVSGRDARRSKPDGFAGRANVLL